jgi:hypothetical protein
MVQAPPYNPPPTARPVAASPSSGPEVPIAFDVWLVTVSLPAHKATDTAAMALATEIDNLPFTLGSRNDVRALIDRLRAAEMLQRLREFRVQGSSGEAANIVTGASVPSIMSSTVTGRSARGNLSASGAFVGDPSVLLGTRVNSIQYQQIGTNVQLLPHVDASGGIGIKFVLTLSEIEKDPDVAVSESTDGSGRIAADRIVTQTIKAAVKLESGKVALVHSDAESSWVGRAGKPVRLVFVGATVTGPPQQSQQLQSDPSRQRGASSGSGQPR